MVGGGWIRFVMGRGGRQVAKGGNWVLDVETFGRAAGTVGRPCQNGYSDGELFFAGTCVGVDRRRKHAWCAASAGLGRSSTSFCAMVVP